MDENAATPSGATALRDKLQELSDRVTATASGALSSIEDDIQAVEQTVIDTYDGMTSSGVTALGSSPDLLVALVAAALRDAFEYRRRALIGRPKILLDRFTSMGAEDTVSFAVGLGTGFVTAAYQALEDHLTLPFRIVRGMLEFYPAVYLNPPLWAEALLAWADPTQESIDRVANDMRQHNPRVFDAMVGYVRLSDELHHRIQNARRFHDRDFAPLYAILQMVREQLHLVVAEVEGEILAKSDDVGAVGEIIGRIVGRAVIEVILIALDLVKLAKGTLELGAELYSSGTARKVATDLKEAGDAAAKLNELIDETKAAYLKASEIRSYYDNRALAGVFNEKIDEIYQEANPALVGTEVTVAGKRVVTNGQVAELEKLRSHHIIEDRWWNNAPVLQTQMKQYWSWTGAQTKDGMESINLPVQVHNRSVKTLARVLGWEEGELPASIDETYFGQKLIDALGKDYSKYKNLGELLTAYRDAYATNFPSLGARLEPWFQEKGSLLPAQIRPVWVKGGAK